MTVKTLYYKELRWCRHKMHIPKHLLSLEPELKIPLRISATGLMDMEESTKPTKSDLAGAGNVQCCNCPKTSEAKDREKDSRLFFKKFENFLHNAIFLPRYSDLLTSRNQPRNSGSPWRRTSLLRGSALSVRSRGCVLTQIHSRLGVIAAFPLL